MDCNKESNSSNVYKPCSQFSFQANYWMNGELISNEILKIFISGNRWVYDTTQIEAFLIYENNKSKNEISQIKSWGINESIDDRKWISQSATGFIDDGNEFFLHPFRENQYYFTEIAPFPQLFTPLYQGKNWTSALTIGSGWGIWSDKRV